MQQKNTGKIIAAFLLVTALAVVSVFSVLQFVKEPTPEQIAEYKSENGITEKKTAAELTTEAISQDWFNEEKTAADKTTEKETTEEVTTEEKTTEEKTTEEKTTEEKTTEKKTSSGDLKLEDVAGDYVGKGTYTKFSVEFPPEMFENMSESEIEMAKSMLAGLEGTSFDIAFSLDEDGEWDFDMHDGLLDLDFDSYDFNMPIKEFENNGFSTELSGKDAGVDGKASFEGQFSGSGDDITVEGRFSIDMVYDNVDMLLIVDYSADLSKEDEGV